MRIRSRRMNNQTTSVSPSAKRDLHVVNTMWSGKMHFECDVNDHVVHLDKIHRHGGEDRGPRPKPLLLAAAGGCTGMEIISILEKMRLKIFQLDIEATGELNDEVPKIYKSVHLIFKVRCEAAAQKKILRAIALACEKYCGVIAMLRRFAAVTTEVVFY
jgi:putative redox protein